MDLLLNFFFVIIILLFVHVPTSVLAIDDKYEKCSSRFRCGNMDFRYPFWGGDQSEYCGYPGFKVDCNSDVPQITILDRNYRVLKFDWDSKIVSVAIQDYWDNNCPANPGNRPLNLTIFDYSSDTQNITLYYGCPSGNNELQQAVSAFQFNCSSDETNTDTVNYFSRSSSSTFEICGSNVQVAVFGSTVESIERDPVSANVNQFLRSGFGLQWKANNDMCDRCVQSYGLCGYDRETTEFTCYCHAQPYPSTCPPSTVKKGLPPVIVGVIAAGSAVVGIVMVVFLLLIIRKRRKIAAQTKTRDLQTPPSSNGTTSTTTTSRSQSIPSYPFSKLDLDRGMRSTYFGAHVFSYDELEQATNNFHPSKELGDGGFGTVYYGELKDGRSVAVKRLYENSLKRVEQFMNEVEILTTLRHPNLVTLYGCTSRHSRELLLVYEYIPNGTVADHLHGRNSNSGLLPWPVRLSIAVETANALAFLHTSDVIHRDVKTNNILLENNFRVKVADFGLSRLFPTDVTHVSTAPQGTPGYVDPEYYQCYQLTDKSDVFSFGVVLIELISSLEAVDTNRHRHDINLANMAVNKIQNQALSELVDPSLGFERDYAVRSMVTSVAELAFRCLQQDRDTRPSMQEVLEVLLGIQGHFRTQKPEVVDISADDTALLKNAPPPISPNSASF
ncbi:hypothetical protein Ddye_012162 [Dipteronia dyeriana]|uniref:non-specific serine/threonine protein kinase n=1 Tax=Dipteronia dyeriana TaxID=168575 RepID=A0AAD9X3U4_9ROSI|nr:hypothetical protein Ddye_012162 [Dipteronia dyeriana]